MPQPVLETASARLEWEKRDLSPSPKTEELCQQDYRTPQATLGHNLKNPRTWIRGRAQLLQRLLTNSESLDRRQLEQGWCRSRRPSGAWRFC